VAKPKVKLKRVYEPFEEDDGFRILVDRLWPRGLSKEKARVDLWLKDIAPSDELRKWFAHEPSRWEEFVKRYESELRRNEDTLSELKRIIKVKKTVTLLYSASDIERNNAVALKKILGALT